MSGDFHCRLKNKLGRFIFRSVADFRKRIRQPQRASFRHLLTTVVKYYVAWYWNPGPF